MFQPPFEQKLGSAIEALLCFALVCIEVILAVKELRDGRLRSPETGKESMGCAVGIAMRSRQERLGTIRYRLETWASLLALLLLSSVESDDA